MPTPAKAVHIGADELPFVEIGGGSKLRVLQVKRGEGLWIVENVFTKGYEVQTHRHTGPVWGYTTSGAWKHKVDSVADGPTTLEFYFAACEAQGLPRPNPLVE